MAAVLSGCGEKPESEFQQIVRQSNCVTAKQVYIDYQNNEVAAQQKYQGKLNRICGIVEEIELNLMDEPTISLRGSFLGSVGIGGVDTASAARLSKGSVAVFECNEINELLGTPILTECRMVPTQNVTTEAVSDAEVPTQNAGLDDGAPRQTSDFDDINRYALIAGKQCYISGDEKACQKFNEAFSKVGSSESMGFQFCKLEVTAHVSYSVPCEYKERYLYVFSGGSFGSSE